MRNFIHPVLSLLIVLILCQYLAVSERRCRCLSQDATCWPNATVWQSFNASIQGRLIAAQPSAFVCNSNPPNVNACLVARQEWNNSVWRGNQPGAMQNHNWENSSCSVAFNSTTCNQGSVPTLAVNATLPEHVQTTLQLVDTYNLRLVIKTTGHDYLGRSTAAGALLLWLHYMKNRTLINSWPVCTGENVSNVIRVGAGVQWGEVYHWLASYNLTAIGGASSTVGASGGYLQGGGHGPLTRWQGLAADQVLEFDVILPNGRRATVNACQNTDLFWALRGGGAGTFAVVLSVVLRTYPSPSIIGAFQAIPSPNSTRYASFVHHFVRLLPALADAGWAGYFSFTVNSLVFALLLPNGDMNAGQAMINQLFGNYTDLNFRQPYVYPLPAFIDLFTAILESNNPTGANVILGSRLIPETIVRNQASQVADVFLQTKEGTSASLLGHLVAGGRMSNITQNNSVHPAWRTALLHMIYAQSWSDGTSIEEQKRLAQLVTKKTELLQTIAGGSSAGAYKNEADPNEVNWQKVFFGPSELYDRLKSIKDRVDPNGLLTCLKCVGSEDWSTDLNCPRTSGATTARLLISFTSVLMLISFNQHP